MKKLSVIKVGGGILEDLSSLEIFLNNFSNIDGLKILVHGGGREATHIATLLNIETVMHEGRRVTDAETLKVVTMVYGGKVNKNLVAQLYKRNLKAVGLTGADFNCIISEKRPLTNGIDYGYVGDIKKVDSDILDRILEMGVIPVIAPITMDNKGNLLNTNADTIASCIAIEMSNLYEVDLIYCFEKKGVLRDSDDENSVIPLINSTIFSELKEDNVIGDGMIPKINNALESIKHGVNSVIIRHFSNLEDANSGTRIIN